MKCSKCGTEIKSGDQVCSHCGAVVSMTRRRKTETGSPDTAPAEKISLDKQIPADEKIPSVEEISMKQQKAVNEEIVHKEEISMKKVVPAPVKEPAVQPQMTCRFCGNPAGPDASFCTYCGRSLKEGRTSVQSGGQIQGVSDPGDRNPPPDPPATQDTGSAGWAVLGFCLPVVGLVLWLVWNSSHPQNAKKAGMGALISVIISVVFYIIMFVVGIGSAYL